MIKCGAQIVKMISHIILKYSVIFLILLFIGGCEPTKHRKRDYPIKPGPSMEMFYEILR